MISYDRFWETLKKRGLTQYDLYTTYGIHRSLLDRLRHNQNIEILTLDHLCAILDCNFSDIVEHLPDDDEKIKPITLSDGFLFYIFISLKVCYSKEHFVLCEPSASFFSSVFVF